jgi:tetratricopeptide (TPR) repeat protein
MSKQIRIQCLLILTASLILLIFSSSFAQQLSTPRVSPAAEVMQQIGLSKITINYSRPAVNGREVWGKLVPYGLTTSAFGNGNPSPWRAGANENTTITFNHDVKINGNMLAAGTYGLHLLVNENEDWVFIFSGDNQAWGSFFYDESHDALRVKASPMDAELTEWLQYGFDQVTPNSTRAYLQWEKKKVGFTCEFDAINIALNSIRAQLTGAPGFGWQNWNQGAFYCLQNNINLAEAEKWVRKSISLNANANNDNTLGYILMAQNKNDDALKIFKENVEKYPDNWNIYDSYGEALNNAGDKEGSKKYYEKAFDMAPENQKQRIKGILDNING